MQLFCTSGCVSSISLLQWFLFSIQFKNVIFLYIFLLVTANSFKAFNFNYILEMFKYPSLYFTDKLCTLPSRVYRYPVPVTSNLFVSLSVKIRTHYQILKLLALLTSLTVISDTIVYCNAFIMLFILLHLFNFICSSLL